MAQIERIVSGLGEIRLEPNFRDSLDIFLYVDVIRFPRNQYTNFNWNPPRSEFAKVTWMYDDYVVKEDTIRYPSQRFTVFENQGAQNLLSLICAYDGILDSFVELATCIIECTPISRTNLIKEHQYRVFDVNRLLFSCYSDTALRLFLINRRLQKCTLGDGLRRSPPPPLPPAEMVPMGSPVSEGGYQISESYPDDPSSTQPNPIDEVDTDFPVGFECELINISITATSSVFEGSIETSGQVFGPLAGFEYNTEDGERYGFDAIGLGDPRFDNCGDGTRTNLISFANAEAGDFHECIITEVTSQDGTQIVLDRTVYRLDL